MRNLLYLFMLYSIFNSSTIVHAEEPGKKRKIQGKEEMCFSIPTAQDMLAEIKMLKFEKKENLDIHNKKLKLRDEKVDWLLFQMVSLEKANKALSETYALLKTDNEVLKNKTSSLSVEVAKYKGQRYEYLLWGLGAGVVVTGVVVVVLVLVNSAGK